MFSARLGFMRPDSVDDTPTLWTPNNITSSNILAWFDATDPGDLVIESGLVARMLDLSGNNTLMRNNYGSQQALHLPLNQNGCGCLQFDGVDDRYSQSSSEDGSSSSGNLVTPIVMSNPYAIFSVQNIVVRASNQQYVSLSGSSPDPWIASYLEKSNKFGKIRRDTSTTQVDLQPDTTPGGWHMHYHSYNSNSEPDSWQDTVDAGSINSETTTITASNTMDNLCIGSLMRRNRSNGYTGAFTAMTWNKTLLFDKPLSESEQQKLEGWSAHQLGITDVLPTDHPYKSSAPEA